VAATKKTQNPDTTATLNTPNTQPSL
jgi:hypothetical protein